MATLRELIIKISANSQSFQTEISRASRMGQDYYRTMQNGGRQAAAASRETQRALADLTGQLNSAKASAVGLAGAFAGAYATGHLISLADEWSSVNARLKQASKSSDDFKESQRALMDISQRTGTAFSDNASLFARSAASMREYGYSSEEVLKVTEAISTGLKLSGASTSEASSVITQFSQALAQGVLRGEEFNSVNENGDRVIRALASGMGVARKDLKAMADQGQLTADKVVPALISQLGALQDEYSAMPQTVASATTKIENAFLAWVGGANEATGATSALTGALNAISDNINTVASAAGVLAAIGGSRFIGGMIGDLGSQTAQLVEARKNEIALAAARANTATQSQRKAAADALAAERAYQLAQSELVLAKNTNAEATATQNAIAKRRAMITANAALVQSNRAVAASQQALNSATSVLGLVKTGATGLLGLVGGLPGLLMLGAGAWYTMYQNQEQARRSAQEYAGQIDEIRQKTSKMSLTETDENRGQTVGALVEQNRLVDEQAKKVGKLKNQIDDLNASRGKPGINSENDAEILRAIAIVTDQLAVEEGKLNDMRDKSRGIQQALEEIERRRNDLIREQAWRQNAVYQSMIMMNGQHTEFNRLLGLGNQLLMARQGLANVPLRLPQADLDKKQTDALEKSRRDLELSRLKGEAKERLRLSYAADDLGLTSDPQFQTGRQELINNGLAEWRNNEANKPQKKMPKSDEQKTSEKLEESYKRLISQQQEQLALAGQSTELAKTKYQVTQGELGALSETQKTELLRNSAALDHLNAVERLKSLNQELLKPEEALLKTTRERIKLLREAAPATEQYRETMERISKASVQDAPKFGGIDSSVGGASGELIKVADAQAELEKWHKKQLEMQKELLDEKEINEQTYADRVADINKTNTGRLKDIQAGYTSASLSMFSDLAGQSAQLLQSIGQEGSLAYKTLFFASKAAAIAQAVINTELAATKAMAEGGYILGIPAATAIRAVGYASVGLIAGQTLAGMAHDGIDRVPETGTWLLQKGERVVTASTSAKLDATLDRVKEARQGQAGVGEVHFHNSFSGKPDDATMLALESRLRESERRIKKGLTAQVINPDGEFGRALKSVYPNRRQS
ncbi:MULTISPECIES: phage tail tape measure protein [unclassified Citrobacter]|uniref:phage tail tape measure protein n=1 Tax=unclassified Citrobacter TaxID=2644389 RepID=UPI002574F85D|nr:MULTISPECIES: phage tail tape measure protein [unclassified Citrobacter]MDM2798229.1 tape measure protein [Citrobacter sp. Cpo131]MDM2891553.1 tape measure protein [Citrobacter sp. Cpo060]